MHTPDHAVWSRTPDLARAIEEHSRAIAGPTTPTRLLPTGGLVITGIPS